MNFAQLSVLRDGRGLTLQQVGDAIGSSREAVHSHERGRGRLGPKKAEAFYRLLGLTFEQGERLYWEANLQDHVAGTNKARERLSELGVNGRRMGRKLSPIGA